eukprot:4046056-Prymnesium_polylepis.1
MRTALTMRAHAVHARAHMATCSPPRAASRWASGQPPSHFARAHAGAWACCQGAGGGAADGAPREPKESAGRARGGARAAAGAKGGAQTRGGGAVRACAAAGHGSVGGRARADMGRPHTLVLTDGPPTHTGAH